MEPSTTLEGRRKEFKTEGTREGRKENKNEGVKWCGNKIKEKTIIAGRLGQKERSEG